MHPVVARLGPIRAYRELRGEFSGVVMVLAAGDLVASFGFSLVFPFLTLYLVQRFGASAFEAGLVIAGYSVCSIFSGAVGGWLADRVGRRLVMMVSVGVTGAIIVVMGQAIDLLQIAGLTVALGLIDPAFIPAARAAIADVVPEDRRPRAYGLLSVAASFGWIAGPAIGAGLATLGYPLLFTIAGLIIATYALIAWRWLPETRPDREPAGSATPADDDSHAPPPAARPTPGSRGTAPSVDPRLVFAAFLPISLVIHAVTFQWVTTLPIHAARSLGVPTAQWGLLFAINGILIVLFQLRISSAAERRSKVRMMGLAAGFYSAGYVAAALAGAPGTAVVALAALIVLVTIGEMLLFPLEASFVSDLSPLHQRGRYQGIALAAAAVGSTLGPPIGGWLLDAWPGLTWWLTAGAGLASALAFVALGRVADRLSTGGRRSGVPIGGLPGAPEVAG